MKRFDNPKSKNSMSREAVVLKLMIRFQNDNMADFGQPTIRDVRLGTNVRLGTRVMMQHGELIVNNCASSAR